jgi:phosphohistidine swiveling domain-containing protein
MKTKAERLAELRLTQLKAFTLNQVVITRKQFDTFSPEEILGLLVELQEPLVVRSSAFDEDQEKSNAGRYLSEINVPKASVIESIFRVLNSYSFVNPNDQVLLQSFLSRSELSGVIFTADPNTGSPYFVINYFQGNDTSAITSGAQNGQTLVVSRLHELKFSSASQPFTKLMELAILAEALLDEGPLDLEFAFQDDHFFLLQARPLTGIKIPNLHSEFKQQIQTIQEKIEALSAPHPDLFGDSTMFSVMSDWNPAELIGVRPNQLALSLFRELISDSIWAYERSNYGYRNLRSFPLVLELGGHPYVDYRVSFNSLIPKSISKRTSEKLASFYLEKLKASPELHDKVEFEIYFASWNLQTGAKLTDAGFTLEEKIEIEDSLRSLTSEILTSDPYGIKQTIAKTEQLYERFLSIISSDLSTISKIYWLIEDCKRHGTLPFAGIARSAFISTDLLRSLVVSGHISGETLDHFFSALSTITTKIQADSQTMDPPSFKDKYGHLRPGTFDLNSATYAENFDVYFGKSLSAAPVSVIYDFSQLSEAIIASGICTELNVNADQVIDFCVSSIQLREQLKFDFSRNISSVLNLVADLGRVHGFSREDMSHVKISTVLALYNDASSEYDALNEDVLLGKVKNSIAKSLWLPSLITGPEDLICFELTHAQPNFVTQQTFSGDLVGVSDSLEGKAILIESADPGYDWVFLHGIGALITCWGGANSHMAVRCKELGIPAAIGVGEEIFNRLQKGSVVYLDCANKILEVVK